MAVLGFIPGSMHYRQQGKGIIYEVALKCSQDDIVPFLNPELPQMGDHMPGNDYYTVVDIDADEDENGVVAYKVTYSTDRELAESFCDESITMSLEPINDLKGKLWKNARTPISNPLTRCIPIFTLNIRLKDREAPLDKCADHADKVNSMIFRGRAAGTLQFKGIDADNSYDSAGGLISAATIYHFAYRKRPWNQMWREPLQAKHPLTNNEIHWHNEPDLNDRFLEPFRTTDSAKLGTPVWINETPGQSENIAGIGDWDEPDIDGGYFEECDFAEVLGIPKKAGDE